MPVQVIWDDDAHTCLRQVYFGVLTLDDYINATNEVNRMAQLVPHTVHTIMDRTQVLTTPGVMLPAMRYANKHLPPNLGIRVILKSSLFTRTIVDLGRRVAPRLIHDVYFVESLEDARAIIAERANGMQRAS